MPLFSFKSFYIAQVLALSHARSFRGAVENRSLVIGGGEAEKGRHPYMVSLQDDTSHFCGGSLIAPDVVLTAAHCKTPDSFLAVGRHHWSNNKEGKEVEISDSVSHEEFEYGSDNYDNDIMLLFLDEPIHDIPIVTINSNSSLPEVKSPVTVIGWGDTDIDWLKFEMSDVLINAEVCVQSNEECEASQGEIRGDPHWYDGRVTQNMLCAEAEKIDACNTDSGGPLLVRGESREEDIQVGIVSWGYSCAHEDFPGVYTRVSSYYKWIREHICTKSSYPPASFHCSSQHVTSEEDLSVEIIFDDNDEEVEKIEIEVELNDRE